MLDDGELRAAVDIQRRSYQLLLWLETAIEKGFVGFERAHEYATEAESAADWIREHFENLPPGARPQSRAEDHLRPFAAMLASYVLSSFTLVERPGQRLMSGCGCLCPMCSHLSNAPHLRLRQVSRKDRDRARKLKIGYLRALAIDASAALSEEALSDLLDDGSLATSIAMATYGVQLVRRARGEIEGPAVLALWREFAWTDGSPRRGYVLDADQVLAAESRVRGRLPP